MSRETQMPTEENIPPQKPAGKIRGAVSCVAAKLLDRNKSAATETPTSEMPEVTVPITDIPSGNGEEGGDEPAEPEAPKWLQTAFDKTKNIAGNLLIQPNNKQAIALAVGTMVIGAVVRVGLNFSGAGLTVVGTAGVVGGVTGAIRGGIQAKHEIKARRKAGETISRSKSIRHIIGKAAVNAVTTGGRAATVAFMGTTFGVGAGMATTAAFGAARGVRTGIKSTEKEGIAGKDKVFKVMKHAIGNAAIGAGAYFGGHELIGGLASNLFGGDGNHDIPSELDGQQDSPTDASDGASEIPETSITESLGEISSGSGTLSLSSGETLDYTLNLENGTMEINGQTLTFDETGQPTGDTQQVLDEMGLKITPNMEHIDTVTEDVILQPGQQVSASRLDGMIDTNNGLHFNADLVAGGRDTQLTIMESTESGKVWLANPDGVPMLELPEDAITTQNVIDEHDVVSSYTVEYTGAPNLIEGADVDNSDTPVGLDNAQETDSADPTSEETSEQDPSTEEISDAEIDRASEGIVNVTEHALDNSEFEFKQPIGTLRIELLNSLTGQTEIREIAVMQGWPHDNNPEVDSLNQNLPILHDYPDGVSNAVHYNNATETYQGETMITPILPGNMGITTFAAHNLYWADGTGRIGGFDNLDDAWANNNNFTFQFVDNDGNIFNYEFTGEVVPIDNDWLNNVNNGADPPYDDGSYIALQVCNDDGIGKSGYVAKLVSVTPAGGGDPVPVDEWVAAPAAEADLVDSTEDVVDTPAEPESVGETNTTGDEASGQDTPTTIEEPTAETNNDDAFMLFWEAVKNNAPYIGIFGGSVALGAAVIGVAKVVGRLRNKNKEKGNNEPTNADGDDVTSESDGKETNPGSEERQEVLSPENDAPLHTPDPLWSALEESQAAPKPTSQGQKQYTSEEIRSIVKKKPLLKGMFNEDTQFNVKFDIDYVQAEINKAEALLEQLNNLVINRDNESDEESTEAFTNETQGIMRNLIRIIRQLDPNYTKDKFETRVSQLVNDWNSSVEFKFRK